MRTVRVYNQVFRIEKTVYSLQGVHLPVPISYRQMAFFVCSLIAIIILNKFPPLSWIDFFLIKFVAIPIFISWFFTRKTLDGKSPHRFILRASEYYFSPHHLSKYEEIMEPIGGKYQYIGKVSCRHKEGKGDKDKIPN